MKYILGTKQYMTQIFAEDGRVTPGTVIAAGPVTVTQVKTVDRDGYSAVQVGFGHRPWSRLNRPQQGHGKKAAKDQPTGWRWFKEFRLPAGSEPEVKLGQTIDLSVFTVGDKVTVCGTTKGKGFQGVVKRHNFAGGPRSHGQKHSEREPGSIGAMGVQKVIKGTRMAGRMGGETVTVKNLTVLAVNPEQGQLVITGAVPGRPGSLLAITSNEK